MTWREVARELGHRMEHHAFCEEHAPADADPDNCPFCHDRKVYLDWYGKELQALRKDRSKTEA